MVLLFPKNGICKNHIAKFPVSGRYLKLETSDTGYPNE